MTDLAFPFLPEEDQLAVDAAVNTTSFIVLYRRYYPRVYNYVRYRSDDLQTAEDLVAQTFERALANLAKYHPGRGPFGAWLFAIARNTVAAQQRRRHLRFWVAIDDLSPSPSDEPGPEETLLSREKHQDLLAALGKLSDRERDILGLKFAGQLNNRQIAGLSGLSESNVGVILFRAIGRLKTEMTRLDPAPDRNAARSEHTHE